MAEGMWKPKTDFYDYNKYNDMNSVPSYFPLGMLLGTTNLEVGYLNSHSERWYIIFEVTTVMQPYGTCEFFDGEMIKKYSFSVWWYMPTLFENLSFGVTLGFDFVKQEEVIANFSGKITGTRLQIISGL